MKGGRMKGGRMKVYIVFFEHSLRPRRWNVKNIFSSFRKAEKYLLDMPAKKNDTGIFTFGDWNLYIEEYEVEE